MRRIGSQAWLRHQVKQLNDRRELRKQVIAVLGGKCIKCGFNDSRALQIDHVNSDGPEDRKLGNDNWKIYKTILQNPTNPRYQLLCANCN